MYPSSWTDEEPRIAGSEQVHAFLTRYIAPATADRTQPEKQLAG
jgi:hypothetical protein